MRDAEPDDVGRAEAVEAPPVELDVPAAERQEPRHGAQGRGLARPVAADESHRLALADLERGFVHSRHVSVADLDAVNAQQDGHTRLRDRPR